MGINDGRTGQWGSAQELEQLKEQKESAEEQVSSSKKEASKLEAPKFGEANFVKLSIRESRS